MVIRPHYLTSRKIKIQRSHSENVNIYGNMKKIVFQDNQLEFFNGPTCFLVTETRQ